MKQKRTLLLVVSSFFMCMFMYAQERSISGIVKSIEGDVLPGATVIIKGTSVGTTTDFDGKFSLMVSSEAKKMEISFMGYNTKVIVLGNKLNFEIVLEEDMNKLDEVVIVGYGSQKRTNLTGAVSAISTTSIESRPITSASQSLAGKMSGVHVAQSSGIAGADGAKITIRGLGTLSSSDPLILIDGVISDNFDLVNPSDIESISVLKDAASASIYGARAGNGVVLITTKKGAKGSKSVFTYEGGSSISDVTDQSRPKMITDPEVFMMLMNEARTNSGGNSVFPDEVIELYRTPYYRNAVSTDWYDEIVRKGYTQEHNISARGGSETNQFYMSLGYLDQDAIILDGKYQRISSRINFQTQILPEFRVGVNFGYTYGNQRTPNGSVNDTSLLNVMRATPLSPAYSDDGLLAEPDGRSLSGLTGQVQLGSPLAGYLANDINSTKNNILGSIFAEYEIIDNLKVKVSLNSNINLDNSQSWYGTPTGRNWNYKYILENPLDLNADGIVTDEEIEKAGEDPTLGDLTTFYGSRSLEVQTMQSYRLNPDLMVTYDKVFGKSKLSVLAGLSSETNTYNWVTTSRRNFDSNLIKVFDAGDPTTTYNSSRISKNALVSQYGRLNYNYDDRYLLEANVRRDGSSRFGENYKYGIFPSFSAGWTLSNEKFFENIKVINYFKIRASWGQLGNQTLGDDFPYISKVSFSNSTYNYGKSILTGAISSSYGNPDLRWETTTMTDIGINLSLWNSSISIEADYFDRKSEGVLYDTPIPLETGFTSVITNLATVSNKGIEGAINFNVNIKDFNISGGVNATNIKNKVLSINPEADPDDDHVISGNKILARGRAIGEFYLVKWTGNIFQSDEEVANNPSQFGAKAGDLIFEDYSGPYGVPDGIIDGFDRQPVGTQYPEWTFGADLNLRYRSFSLSATFQGIAKAFSYGSHEYFYPTFQGSNIGEHWVNRWTADNPSATMPRLWSEDGPNTENQNTYFLMDRSYLRLKMMVFAYDLPSKYIERVALSGLRLFVSGQNLYTWTNNFKGFDPEMSRDAGSRGGLPQAMTVKFGVRLSI